MIKNALNTKFHGNGISKQDSRCVCLSVLLSDSVVEIGEIYYPEVFLEECKYVVKENEVSKFINEMNYKSTFFRKIILIIAE